MARLSKEDYRIEKQKEQKLLESQLAAFLKDSIKTKSGMDKLTSHYKISGLYNYTFLNSILINLQGGNIAQSFKGWITLNRCVKKGEKSKIHVFAPLFRKIKDVTKKETEKETEKSILIGFKMVPVFDVNQTEGDELEYDHNSSVLMDVSYNKIHRSMETLCKIKIDEEITGNARGFSDGKRIVISNMSNDTDKTKTLFHEVAHHLLHTGNKKTKPVSTSTKEIEAESISYLVMSYLGIDYELSKNYVSSWNDGIADARHFLIIKTADKIITEIKKTLTIEEKFIIGL